MRLVMLGGPGSGKGTQARQLSRQLSISWISTGDILREAIAHQTPLGIQVQSDVEKGELVPDPAMIEFIRQRLLQPDASSGWLLDGYPRTAFQAEELDFLLDQLDQQLSWAIYLQVPEAVMSSRSVARSRLDDQPEVVQRRVQLFRDRTFPILDYYEHRRRLITVDGNQSPEAVQQDILQKLIKRR